MFQEHERGNELIAWNAAIPDRQKFRHGLKGMRQLATAAHHASFYAPKPIRAMVVGILGRMGLIGPEMNPERRGTRVIENEIVPDNTRKLGTNTAYEHRMVIEKMCPRCKGELSLLKDLIPDGARPAPGMQLDDLVCQNQACKTFYRKQVKPRPPEEGEEWKS